MERATKGGGSGRSVMPRCMDRISARAVELLAVTQDAYPESPEGFAIKQTLGAAFNSILDEKRPVQNMPLAVQLREDGQRYWTGPDIVLGPLAEGKNGKGNDTVTADLDLTGVNAIRLEAIADGQLP